MRELDFRRWLIEEKGLSPKVAKDMISRLRKIERELKNCDIDEQYRRDGCQLLLRTFSHMGINAEMKKYPSANFPIGEYYMSTYRYAVSKYKEYMDALFGQLRF